MSETSCKNCERIGRTCPACIAERIKPATPPTPDRAAVRERLMRVIAATTFHEASRLAESLGVSLSHNDWVFENEGVAVVADALLRPAPLPADVQAMVARERAAWIDGAAWASMENDEISVAGIEAAAEEKFGPGAAPSDEDRVDWLAQQATPHHGVILCASSQPNEPWASVQRVDHFHNPHKVQWCVEGGTLRDAIDRAMAEVPTLTLAPDDPERDRSLAAVSRPAEARGEPVAWAVVGRDAGLMRVEGDKAAADAWCVQLAPGWADGDSWRVQPLYTHPAPSGGEPTDAEVDAALKSLEVTHHWNTPTRERVRLALKCANQATRPAPVVTEAARALIEKLDAIDADPHYQGIWQFADAHGVKYKGPTYEAELFALRAALAAARGEV